MSPQAGGASSCDGLCVSGLDVEVTQHDQRTQICYGSVGEVGARRTRQCQAASVAAPPLKPRHAMPQRQGSQRLGSCVKSAGVAQRPQ